MPAFKDITGNRYGHLTVIRLSHRKNGSYWLVRCDCGIERVVAASWLGSGNSTSCGSCSKLGNKRARRHGYSPKGPRTPLYNTWQSIKKRTTNPNHPGFKYWGGKGTIMIARWLDDFAVFAEEVLKEIGDRPAGMTIDRINPAGDYEPGNIRWATPLQQRHNRRP